MNPPPPCCQRNLWITPTRLTPISSIQSIAIVKFSYWALGITFYHLSKKLFLYHFSALIKFLILKKLKIQMEMKKALVIFPDICQKNGFFSILHCKYLKYDINKAMDGRYLKLTRWTLITCGFVIIEKARGHPHMISPFMGR